MFARDILIKLLYDTLIKNNFKPDGFSFDYCNGVHAISTMDISHTRLLKIRFESDYSLCLKDKWLASKDIVESTFEYKDTQSTEYYRMLDTFDEFLFDKKDYSEYSFCNLQDTFNNFPSGQVTILHHGAKSVFNIDYLKSCFLTVPESLHLKLINGDSGPICGNYEFSCFDVYFCVASTLLEIEDSNVILKVY